MKYNIEIETACSLRSKNDELQFLIIDLNGIIHRMNEEFDAFTDLSILIDEANELQIAHRNITSWIDNVLAEINNIETPKFDDFSQPSRKSSGYYQSIFDAINEKYQEYFTKWKNKRAEMISQIENFESRCRDFENDQLLQIDKLTLLKPQVYNFYRDEEGQEDINEHYENFVKERLFFNDIWIFLNRIDEMMDTLLVKNQEIDIILLSDTKDISNNYIFIIQHFESRQKVALDKLNSDLNQADFPMSESAKTTAILRLLRPVKQEFGKLQAKIKDLIDKIDRENNKSEPENLGELKSRYETNLSRIKNSTDMNLRYEDICWPCSGTVDRMIEVLLHGVERHAFKRAIRQHLRFWHPDKFQQKLSDRLHPNDRQKILEKVHQISVGLNNARLD